jgi:hypothetical protein
MSSAADGRAMSTAELIAALHDRSSTPDIMVQLCELLFERKADCDAGAVVSAVVAAMRVHAAHAQSQYHGVLAFCDELVTVSIRNGAADAAADAVDAILAAMRTHRNDKNIQRVCCLALSVTCCRPQTALADHAIAAGGVQSVIAAMQGRRSDWGVQQVGCGAVTALFTACSGQAAGIAGMFLTDAVRAVVLALRDHLTSPQVQFAALCGLSSSMMQELHVRATAVNLGAVEAICASLCAHATDVDVQHKGCAALAVLFYRGVDAATHGRAKLLSVSALDAAVAAMTAHRAAAQVQQSGCGAILCVADATIRKYLEDTAEPIAGGGGSLRCCLAAIRAVVAAMQAHPDARVVQLFGCDALNSLCVSSTEDSEEIRAQACYTEGAIEAVVAAFAYADVLVQRTACYALRAMALENKAGQDKAGDAGALAAVTAAMHRNSADADFQFAACLALRFLTSNNAANKVKAGAAGAIEAIVAAMNAHPGAGTRLSFAACHALANVTCGNARNQAAASSRAVAAIVVAMRVNA